MQFHDDAFLKQLDETEGCEQLGIEGGHYFMHDDPTTVLYKILSFLNPT
jgi:hypothetical protein